ncbi:MAG: ribonuclease H-like domain-containing protein [Bacteroidetes bacterium]|nr:ribonuclease H-like domain-containing protein [Bacteroidota bacterium]MBU1720393.1 ribonuclease H-like domain-containing protein [Bacteroidota bacterium]
MLSEIKPESILFLDIETVSQCRKYDDLDPEIKIFWDKKATNLSGNTEPDPAGIYGRAGIYAEFGKIICIGIGYLVSETNTYSARLKTIAGKDEAEILQRFCELLRAPYFRDRNIRFCAHNGKEFDYPYIARRLMINGIEVPPALDLAGKKPWEVKHLDTLELWKFGDYKSYTSLALLATVLGIPTPKDDIDGSMVGKVFWEDDDLVRIQKYCIKDVLTVMQVLLRFKGLPLLLPENIVVSDESGMSEP